MDDAYVALALYTGIAAIMLVVMTINVGLNRGAQKAALPGQMGEGPLTRAIRAHANFTEYTPLVLLMLGILALNRTAALPIHVLGATFMVARVLHFIGMMQPKHPNLLRMISTLTTVIVLAAGGVLCFLRVYENL